MLFHLVAVETNFTSMYLYLREKEAVHIERGVVIEVDFLNYDLRVVQAGPFTD